MASKNEKQIKNKEQTKRRLISTVAEVFKTEGYAGLGVNKIAREAGVSKKLIYRYFGGLAQLVEAYIVETDYWLRFATQFREIVVPTDKQETKRMISEVLQNQFNYFGSDKGMQELIRWELSSNSDLMRSIHRTRETMGQQLLEMTDPYLGQGQINFRAVAALLVGGIYYIILHTRHNGGMFSDVNVSTEAGRKEILKAIDQVVALVFEA